MRTNNEIFEEMKKFFKDHEADGVNLMLFVFKEGRFYTRRLLISSPDNTRHFQSQTSSISAMVVTCCDFKTAEDREAIVRDLKVSCRLLAQRYLHRRPQSV